MNVQPGESCFTGNRSYAYKLYSQLLGGASFTQNTRNNTGYFCNLNDINNDLLSGSIDVNTYLVMVVIFTSMNFNCERLKRNNSHD